MRPELVGVSVVSPPIAITAPTQIVARSKHGDDWSGRASVTFTVVDRLRNDLNNDGQVDAQDIDRLCSGIQQADSQFDMNNDGRTDQAVAERDPMGGVPTKRGLDDQGPAVTQRIFRKAESVVF